MDNNKQELASLVQELEQKITAQEKRIETLEEKMVILQRLHPRLSNPKTFIRKSLQDGAVIFFIIFIIWCFTYFIL